MSKKKNLQQETLISEGEKASETVVVTDEKVSKPAKEKKAAKDDKSAKNQKNAKKKDKNKESAGKKIRRKTRETVSELKKVTWPGFGEVCKRTGIVLSFVVIFAVVLFGLDTLLGYLFGLLT